MPKTRRRRRADQFWRDAIAAWKEALEIQPGEQLATEALNKLAELHAECADSADLRGSDPRESAKSARSASNSYSVTRSRN